MRITYDGEMQSRMFRKPQKKPLTLNIYSHHTTRTKIATVESMYNTAELVPSDLNHNQQFSTKMVDNVYSTMVIQKIREKRKKSKTPNQPQ